LEHAMEPHEVALLKVLLGVGLLLMVILLPLSHQDCEYYQFGLLKRRSTGAVDLSKVFLPGRYWNGPDYTMQTYQGDLHFSEFKELPVFSSTDGESIGLEFKLDIFFTYSIVAEELTDLHKEFKETYRAVVDARARDGIKNQAAQFKFTDYFTQRIMVEQALKEAVYERLLPVHVKVKDLHMGRVSINEKVREKQLDARVQFEVNDEAEFQRAAQLERDATNLQVAEIDLQTARATALAEAEAVFIEAEAEAEAERVERMATVQGMASLYTGLNITQQRHKTSLDYLRMLRLHDGAKVSSTYLDRDNVLATVSKSQHA